MPLVSLFTLLKYLSFFGSLAFGLLLICWLAPGLTAETAVLGWVHGFTWIGLALLAAGSGGRSRRRRAL
jgi:hypothetical protein